MGLRLKFNVVLVIVFLLGLGVTGYVSYDLLRRNAREEVLRSAGVMVEAALSMRSYTVNPRDRAAEWEADLVSALRNQPELKELSGERATPTGRSLFLTRPLAIRDPACLACHSVPSAAPVTLVKRYGDRNGFGWKLNEILGAQVVSVPMDLPIRNDHSRA
jgi:protein-histidine pros-kinase